MAMNVHNRGARRDVRVSTDRDRALSVNRCAIDSAALADFDARPRRVYEQSHRLNACMVAKIAGTQDRVSTHEDLSLENLDVGTSLHPAAFLELHASERGEHAPRTSRRLPNMVLLLPRFLQSTVWPTPGLDGSNTPT